MTKGNISNYIPYNKTYRDGLRFDLGFCVSLGRVSLFTVPACTALLILTLQAYLCAEKAVWAS